MHFESSNVSKHKSEQENMQQIKAQFELLADNLNYLVARIETLEKKVDQLESEGK